MAEQLQVLAARAQLGDRAALEKMLKTLERPLGAHIRGIVRDYDVAEDVLQESLIVIYKKLGSLRDSGWIRPWSYRIATREAVRAARRMGRGIDLSEQTGEVPDESVQTDDAEILAEMHERIDSLPPACSVVLRMRYVDDFSQIEIAEALSIPAGTVKSRIAYGLGLLRKEVTGNARAVSSTIVRK